MPANIHDGYTRARTLDAKYGWDPFTISFRVAIPEQVQDYRNSIRTSDGSPLGGVAQSNARWKFVKPFLITWDAKGPAGAVLDLNYANFRTLPDYYVSFIIECICGYGPADILEDEKNS